MYKIYNKKIYNNPRILNHQKTMSNLKYKIRNRKTNKSTILKLQTYQENN